jgi:hypothetical protein
MEELTSGFIEPNGADADLQHLIPLGAFFKQKIALSNILLPSRRIIRLSRDATEFQVEGHYVYLVSLMVSS